MIDLSFDLPIDLSEFNLLTVLCSIGLLILWVVANLAIIFLGALILIFLATLGLSAPYGVYRCFVRLEVFIFRKIERSTTTLYAGWLSLICGGITGLLMAYHSGVLRLSWNLTLSLANKERFLWHIRRTLDSWAAKTVWQSSVEVNGYSLYVSTTQLIASFLESAQYLFWIPLVLVALETIRRSWFVPGFFRKLIYGPFLLVMHLSVYIAIVAGINFVVAPLGIIGLLVFVFGFGAIIAGGTAVAGTAEVAGKMLDTPHQSNPSRRPLTTPSQMSSAPEESSSSGTASNSGIDVESQDMFNGKLVHTRPLGPDQHLEHDKSQDSIYGNTYVDRDSGKEYRVIETDAFGHPTKVEEKWP